MKERRETIPLISSKVRFPEKVARPRSSYVHSRQNQTPLDLVFVVVAIAVGLFIGGIILHQIFSAKVDHIFLARRRT